MITKLFQYTPTCVGDFIANMTLVPSSFQYAPTCVGEKVCINYDETVASFVACSGTGFDADVAALFVSGFHDNCGPL